MSKKISKQDRAISKATEIRLFTDRQGRVLIDFMGPRIDNKEGHDCPSCQCRNYVTYLGYSLILSPTISIFKSDVEHLRMYALKNPEEVIEG